MSDVDVLAPAPLPALVTEALETRFRLHRLWAAADQDALLAQIGPRVRAVAAGVPILTEGVSAPVTRSLMERLPALEIVANLGVGYDNIDVAAAAQRGIVVTNTPDVLTEETADTAFGLVLNAVRQFPRAERHLRAGRWLEGPFELTASLRGRTLGVLGLGRIGRAVGRRGEAFGVAIAYHSRNRAPDAPWRYCPSTVELAHACDILVVCAPGGSQTRHIVDAQVLEALGPQGVLVNIARGSLVDEDALIAALQSGRILTAGLDVFEDEPRVRPELLAMDHVVLLPHVGSAAQATRDEMCRLQIDNLVAWADGRDLLTPVAETPWKRAQLRAN